jgi:hypothetical protein
MTEGAPALAGGPGEEEPQSGTPPTVAGASQQQPQANGDSGSSGLDGADEGAVSIDALAALSGLPTLGSPAGEHGGDAPPPQPDSTAAAAAAADAGCGSERRRRTSRELGKLAIDANWPADASASGAPGSGGRAQRTRASAGAGGTGGSGGEADGGPPMMLVPGLPMLGPPTDAPVEQGADAGGSGGASTPGAAVRRGSDGGAAEGHAPVLAGGGAAAGGGGVQWQDSATALAAKVKAALTASDGADAAALTSPAGVKIAAILRCGALTGEAVEYRKGAGGGKTLAGSITAQGLILCECAQCRCVCARAARALWRRLQRRWAAWRVGAAKPANAAAGGLGRLQLRGRAAHKHSLPSTSLARRSHCCRGANAVPNSVFEDHAGSKVRRPAQYTFLTAYNLSLKELGQLVNSTYIDSHISYCILVGGLRAGRARGSTGLGRALGRTARARLGVGAPPWGRRQSAPLRPAADDPRPFSTSPPPHHHAHTPPCPTQCRDGGDLMCCDGCPSAYHPDCLGFASAPNESWFCPACVQVRGHEGPGARRGGAGRQPSTLSGCPRRAVRGGRAWPGPHSTTRRASARRPCAHRHPAHRVPQAGREPPGYRTSTLFRDTQRGMEASRHKLREQHKAAAGAGGAGLGSADDRMAGLPRVVRTWQRRWAPLSSPCRVAQRAGQGQGQGSALTLRCVPPLRPPSPVSPKIQRRARARRARARPALARAVPTRRRPLATSCAVRQASPASPSCRGCQCWTAPAAYPSSRQIRWGAAGAAGAGAAGAAGAAAAAATARTVVAAAGRGAAAAAAVAAAVAARASAWALGCWAWDQRRAAAASTQTATRCRAAR